MELFILEGGFRGGLRSKAFLIEAFERSLAFKLGYYLWGADIWFGRVPMVKSMILANVVVWVMLFM